MTLVDETLVRVRIGETSDAQPSFETVWVEHLSNGHLRLARAPVMALGLGVGDEFRLDTDTGSFEVLTRAGNLTVQLASPDSAFDDHEIDDLRALGYRAGGVLDAHTEHVAAFTIPAEAGFPAVEETFDAFVAAHQGMTWWFGNVYDDEDNPLNWW
jgi:hypothetical protein